MKTTFYTNLTLEYVVINTTLKERLTVHPRSSIKFEGDIKKQKFTSNIK